MPHEERHWNFISPKAYLKKLCSIGPWFSSGRVGWWTLMLLVLALSSPYLWGLAFTVVEKWLKFFGLGIQISGFCLALYGVNSNLKQLGLGSIPRRIWIYLRSMPALPIKYTIVKSGYGAAHGVSSVVSGIGAVRTGAHLSFADRLKRLEERHEELLQNIGDLEKKQKADKDEVLSEVRSVQNESAAALDDLDTKVSNIFDSGVAIEVFGVGLFVIGAVYATIPDVMLSFINAFS